MIGRLQLFELHDFTWCPKVIRDGLTDFLEISIETLDTYAAVRPLLMRAFTESGATRIIDLCSGAGGPWVHWKKKGLVRSTLILTDKFPNLEARQRLVEAALPGLEYRFESVNAAAVPTELAGFRTIFTAFHHFPPDQAKLLIDDAVSKGQPIGVFELTSRSLGALLWMLLSPLGVWAFTPRLPKIGLKKWILTYFIPVIPFVVLIDGIVSCLRTYSPAELRAMAHASNYVWSTGQLKGRGGPITYLIGYPQAPRDHSN